MTLNNSQDRYKILVKIPYRLPAIRIYLYSFRWILEDLWQHFRVRWLLASLVSFAAPTLQAMSFALLTSFFAAFAQGTAIKTKYFNIGFLKPNEASTAFVVSILCFCLLLSSGLARYLGERLFIGLRFNYTRLCLERGAKEIMHYWADDSLLTLRYKLIIVARSDSISCGKLAMLLASAGSPLMEFLVFSLICIYLYPLLTFIIGIVVICTVPFFRILVFTGSHYYSIREQYALASGCELREYVAKSSKDHQDILSKSNDMFFQNLGNTKDWIDSLLEYTLVAPKSIFISTVLSSLALAFMVIFIQISMASGVFSLNQALIYVVVLRYTTRAFQQFTSRFSSLNIFYKQMMRYKKIIKGEMPQEILDSKEIESEEVDDF